MASIAVHTDPPGLLAAIAPLGLARGRGTVLVIDLDPAGVRLPGTRTLRDLVEASPSGDDLAPRRSGTACLPNGGVAFEDAADVVEALVTGWPDTVFRVAREGDGPPVQGGVGVRPVLPGMTKPAGFLPVYQPTGLTAVPDGLRGIVLPRLPGRVAKTLLGGMAAHGRWIDAWGVVWDRALGAGR